MTEVQPNQGKRLYVNHSHSIQFIALTMVQPAGGVWRVCTVSLMMSSCSTLYSVKFHTFFSGANTCIAEAHLFPSANNPVESRKCVPTFCTTFHTFVWLHTGRLYRFQNNVWLCTGGCRVFKNNVWLCTGSCRDFRTRFGDAVSAYSSSQHSGSDSTIHKPSNNC